MARRQFVMSDLANPKHVAERMYSLAEAYATSALVLSQKVENHGDAATLLDIVAFEIMLKCCVLVETGTRPHGHSYSGMFQNIPGDTRSRIIFMANERNAGHIDLADIDKVLVGLERVFAVGRYHYELNDGRTNEEAAVVGRAWSESNSPLDQADVLFYPMERDGLYFGLKQVVEDHLKRSRHT